jgi:hypothetical protein
MLISSRAAAAIQFHAVFKINWCLKYVRNIKMNL